MADLKISELNSLAGVSLANTDLLPVVDTSASQTKKITSVELVRYGYGLVPSGSLDGDIIEAATTAARGTVQLTDSATSTNITTAATPNAVKTAYDLASAANSLAGAALPKSGGTMTGQILADDATSTGTPGYAFDGDSNTGLVRTGADELALVTGGVARLTSDASGNINIPGNLSVQGTTTTINSTTLVVADKNIEMGAVSTPTDITADGGGITLRGTTNKTINWIDSTDAWTSSERFSYPLGSATAPALTFTGDPNTGLYSPGADQVAISTNGTGRLFISSTGKIGIGESSAAEVFEVRDGNIGLDSAGSAVGDRTTERFYKRTDNGSSNGMAAIGMNGTGTNGFLGEIKFYTGLSDVFNTSLQERARIDSSGRLLMGTSTALLATAGADTPLIQFVGASPQLMIARRTDDAVSTHFVIGKSRGTGNEIIANNDNIGLISFQGADGTNLIRGAEIRAAVDGTPGTNDMPGRLVFSTTADGASSPTERMRIAQNGVITIQNGAVAVIGALTDGATITPDFAADCNLAVTLGGSRTMANPINITAGQSGSIFISQSTGSHTLAWGSYWDFAGGTPPTLSTAAGAVDRVDYIVRSSTSIHTVFTANYS
jgi:hypothetical protein